jgi:hypothetical protein
MVLMWVPQVRGPTSDKQGFHVPVPKVRVSTSDQKGFQVALHADELQRKVVLESNSCDNAWSGTGCEATSLHRRKRNKRRQQWVTKAGDFNVGPCDGMVHGEKGKASPRKQKGGRERPMQRGQTQQEDGFAKETAAGALEKIANRVQNIPELDCRGAVCKPNSTEPLRFDIAAQDFDDDEPWIFDLAGQDSDDDETDFIPEYDNASTDDGETDFFLWYGDVKADTSRGDCLAVQTETDMRQPCTGTTAFVAAAPAWAPCFSCSHC